MLCRRANPQYLEGTRWQLHPPAARHRWPSLQNNLFRLELDGEEVSGLEAEEKSSQIFDNNSDHQFNLHHWGVSFRFGQPGSTTELGSAWTVLYVGVTGIDVTRTANAINTDREPGSATVLAFLEEAITIIRRSNHGPRRHRIMSDMLDGCHEEEPSDFPQFQVDRVVFNNDGSARQWEATTVERLDPILNKVRGGSHGTTNMHGYILLVEARWGERISEFIEDWYRMDAVY